MIEIREVFQHLAVSGSRILFACPSFCCSHSVSFSRYH